MESKELKANQRVEPYSFNRVLRWYKVVRREAVCIELAILLAGVIGFFLGFFMTLVSLTIPLGG